MAIDLMHLYVGKYFKDRHFTIKDLPQFYLGCIYPDSVNAFHNGLAPKEIRYPAHLRVKDIDEWYENNKMFYCSSKGKIDESLLLGYVIHNITDAAYDRHYASIDRKDWIRFCNEQCKEEWWVDEVMPALEKAIPVEVNGISKINVEEWLKRVTDGSRFKFPDEKPISVTIDMMNELSDIVCKIVNDFITHQ